MIIQQALFGYDGGHRLLASSCPLSTRTLKILEPLSDLSGAEMQVGFEKYITGYPLNEDGYYAINATWYAGEMNRPGCVWTHSLLIAMENISELASCFNLDDYFLRPDLTDKLVSQYSKPLVIEECINTKNLLSYDQKTMMAMVLEAVLSENSPAFIEAESSNQFNIILPFLFLKLGDLFFKQISFCTGSLSSRSIQNKSLDFQIIPLYTGRGVMRKVPDARIIELNDKSNYCLDWVKVIIENFVCEKNQGFKDFILFFDINTVNRWNLKPFSELYGKMLRDEKINNIDTYISFIMHSFHSGEQKKVLNKFLEWILVNQNSKSVNVFPFNSSIILQALSTANGNYVSYLDFSILDSYVKTLWDSGLRKEVYGLISKLIHAELNMVGEYVLTQLASLLTLNDMSSLLALDIESSNVLIALNHELIVCEDIWKQNKNFQLEILGGIKGFANDISDALLWKTNRIIFKVGREDISEALYVTFGDVAINTFFEWGQNQSSEVDLEQWISLCSFNVTLTVERLHEINNATLLKHVLIQLDPYNPELLLIRQDLWVDIYKQYCVNLIDFELCEAFAELLLPLILQSSMPYPDKLVNFAFTCVHNILKENRMDYQRWKKLSCLLPEVGLFNGWDKCKRLRKAAKKLNYKIDFD